MLIRAESFGGHPHPTYSANPKAKRIEFRTPDAAANPYVAFAALLLAGLDGIQNRIDPGDPLDKNLYELPPEELADVPSVPDSLGGAIAALEADHAFLLRGDVFNAELHQQLGGDEAKGIRQPSVATASVRVSDVLRRLASHNRIALQRRAEGGW